MTNKKSENLNIHNNSIHVKIDKLNKNNSNPKNKIKNYHNNNYYSKNLYKFKDLTLNNFENNDSSVMNLQSINKIFKKRKTDKIKIEDNEKPTNLEHIGKIDFQTYKNKNIQNKKLVMLNQIQSENRNNIQMPKPDQPLMKKKLIIYKKCIDILTEKYDISYFENKEGNLFILLLHDIIAIIICISYYFLLKFIVSQTKRPILCDMTDEWPEGIFYGNRSLELYKNLPDCSIMCDIKGNLLSLDNNYLLTKLILLGYFLLRLNMSICLLHSICKKFHCLFVLFVLLQILTTLFSLYFAFVNNKSFLNGIILIVFILLSFLESKSSFLMSFLFLLCFLFVQISIIFIHKIYTKFLIENMIGIVIFPICQYLIIVIFNLNFNIKIMRFMPVNLKYALYFILNCCFEGFKSGMYFISSENGFANFHFIILLFFDVFMNFAKKYKLFERCLTTLINICNEKFKSQITETDRLNDIANI